MTAAQLRKNTAKELAQLARRIGISGWHSMKKEELIEAIMRSGKLRGKGKIDLSPSNNPATRAREDARRNLKAMQKKLANMKSLATCDAIEEGREEDDFLVIMVRDPYWLHATWRLSPSAITRTQGALGHSWHDSHPTLRVFQVGEAAGYSGASRDIPIHGGVSNWYVDVADPPNAFRMELGYSTAAGSFYSILRSNTVETPPADSKDRIDNNWADIAEHADRIFAMSGGYSAQGASRELQERLEARLQRPLGTPMHTRYGTGASGDSVAPLELAVDAEVIIYGVTSRLAHVTLQGTPVKIGAEGTFSAKLTLSELRQVIPIVASSCDGMEQRTVILALERNTKVLEPVFRDFNRKG